MSVLSIRNINKTYKKTKALDSINLDIKGIYGLLGPNGAGKTTLMRIIATLLNKDTGEINCDELSWNDLEGVRNIIGYLPQYFSMYPNSKVYDLLDHIAVLKGINDKKCRQLEISDLLIKLNLDDAKNKKIKELSGGMVRRVGIAQALIGNPKIIIVDEPTAGLDIEERVRFRELLRLLGKDKIIILSTHIVDDIEYTCENIGILKKGKIVITGSRAEILKKVDGYIHEIEVKLYGEKYNEITKKYKVISNRNIEDDLVLLRFISKEKVEGSTIVKPNLEDSYLFLTGDK
ncbi:MAG: ATP-binding cassette domain-containing protein [Clostridium sp.]